ncbi:Bug family tripartite tricarboxylate transporter substrate binding protein [Paracraurococcus ruber]|uniref:MFS transporter n=1 Tax=Paracraurococcus ruber TaxID=77675 RepID=A0ABS1D2P4_9PROT|nr:tripartite tricarboxylate transporter substrate binding protein [Paracraurococcus ruber]MBK1661064.1 MFS transporter [Paracraurococcus ruber]TDG30957.1 tripartite tricarboxylate transporter substrate binding protein [Paracraurococcus ruber]
MALVRRTVLARALGVAALPATPSRRAAAEAAYPSRPVRLVIGFPPGGPMDIMARLAGQVLSTRLGQPFVVESRPGAGSNIGTELVVRAAPDGHTLLVFGPVNTINETLYETLSFTFSRDIEPVAGLARVPFVLIVHPGLPVRSVPELVAHARANPGRIGIASAGNGTPQHVAAELFKRMAGVEMIHVPYRGSGPALTDLVGGQVQVMIDAVPSSIEHVRSGRVRALAVTTAARADMLPEVPSLSDTLPGYEVSSWYGIGAPKGTPAAVVRRLNEEVNAGLAAPALDQRLAQMGAQAMPGTPEDLGRLILAETDRWRQVVRAAGIRVE